jgi:hypothetical protein
MDNFKLDIVAEGDSTLLDVLKICFEHNCPGKKAGHYAVTGDRKSNRPTLVLLWHQEKKSTKHPFEMDLEDVHGFVRGWLRTVDRGTQPDHDGDNGHGFRVFTEDWGHVFDHQYAICGIQPVWAMYGK